MQLTASRGLYSDLFTMQPKRKAVDHGRFQTERNHFKVFPIEMNVVVLHSKMIADLQRKLDPKQSQRVHCSNVCRFVKNFKRGGAVVRGGELQTPVSCEFVHVTLCKRASKNQELTI